MTPAKPKWAIKTVFISNVKDFQENPSFSPFNEAHFWQARLKRVPIIKLGMYALKTQIDELKGHSRNVTNNTNNSILGQFTHKGTFCSIACHEPVLDGLHQQLTFYALSTQSNQSTAVNKSQQYHEFMETPRIEPRAAECPAWTLPLCYATSPS